MPGQPRKAEEVVREHKGTRWSGVDARDRYMDWHGSSGPSEESHDQRNGAMVEGSRLQCTLGETVIAIRLLLIP